MSLFLNPRRRPSINENSNFPISAAPKLNVPPRFRDTAFFDKGENVIVKIPFVGYPKPRIFWSRDGETIESGAHFAIETTERHAILTIRDGSKIDSGSYRIVAENDLGQDSAIINIQISGKIIGVFLRDRDGI